MLGGEDEGKAGPHHPGVPSPDVPDAPAKQRANLGFLDLGEGLPTANLDLVPKISIFKGSIVTRK